MQLWVLVYLRIIRSDSVVLEDSVIYYACMSSLKSFIMTPCTCILSFFYLVWFKNSETACTSYSAPVPATIYNYLGISLHLLMSTTHRFSLAAQCLSGETSWMFLGRKLCSVVNCHLSLQWMEQTFSM